MLWKKLIEISYKVFLRFLALFSNWENFFLIKFQILIINIHVLTGFETENKKLSEDYSEIILLFIL